VDRSALWVKQIDDEIIAPLLQLHRKHPPSEEKATRVIFVVAMLNLMNNC
jgi:hypothetical protein